ncbi:MAG: zinc ribbon domain-containing protein [Ruminococcus sp.]|nr:zinc ribbon domain-containing protein [Ruminococcus sp.]
MFCKNCGNQVDDGVKFCKKCGAAMTAAAPVAEPVQAAAPQPVQAAPQGDLEALKASIAEREYKFKGNTTSRSFTVSIIGGIIIFKLGRESLDINYEDKNNTTIPYTDLKSYRYEDKTRIGYIIGSLFYILLGVLFLWFGIAAASSSEEGGVVAAGIFIGLLSLVVAALMIFYFASGTDFIVETHSGQTFKTKMRRISGKKEADRDAFVRDLNIMLQ